jgi:hypothetical protein
MNLVAYSDSEGSDNDAPRPPKPAQKPTAKPAVHKVVDRSNPGKIKVSLPSISRPNPNSGKDAIEDDAPPAKKARTGGGAFSGFNAMLPAPKKPNATHTEAASSGKSKFGNGFNGGVSFKLKTSAEPAFVRETVDGPGASEIPAAHSHTAQSTAAPLQTQPSTATTTQPAWTARFVPLSVANARKKRKPVLSQAVSQASKTTESVENTNSVPSKDEIAAPKPKVSLFSIAHDDGSAPQPVPSGQYQPLLYGAGDDEDTKVPEQAFDAENTSRSAPLDGVASNLTGSHGPQSLADIASSLNLSEAERRQLFGRKRGGDISDLPATNIVEFNTDAEYAHNEKLRASGETVQHNALRSITGTGKNSLRSLVNVATTQKDALEEHFAQGRRNKKESGSKYGW